MRVRGLGEGLGVELDGILVRICVRLCEGGVIFYLLTIFWVFLRYCRVNVVVNVDYIKMQIT